MPEHKSRTREQIFAEMHRELRNWNQDIPESPDRMDPILKILLQLYSQQLARIDTRLDQVWTVATNALIKSLLPESKRWPVPAFTVMRCAPTDPVVVVDRHTRFFHRDDREGGQTFFFSPRRTENLVSARVKHVFMKIDNTLVDLSPSSLEGSSTHTRIQITPPGGQATEIYLAIEHYGPAANFKNAAIFLKGNPDALKQLRWAYWLPGTASGRYLEKASFCPGLTSNLETMFTEHGRPINWGGLRSSTDLFKPLENNFVVIPDKFTGGWEPGPPSEELAALVARNSINLATDNENTYWIRLQLPRGGNKSSLMSSFEVNFNCFVVINKNELTLFKHTGGNRLVEIELPEKISNILEIIDVVDSNGRTYFPHHEAVADPEQKFYSLEERRDKLVLWFDFSQGIELPPDSITVNYAVTAGTDANGIEAGKISELYENHPGITSVENIIPASGAIPARTEEQILTEVSARLRSRDRALSFAEVANWTKTFDPRITAAVCENGIERADHGVRRCIIVTIKIKNSEFYSDDEIALLQTRLNSFLKERSPVNTHYRILVEKV
nr:type VI secretion system baseplate subunit TssF [candidate division Zixibacteria bacterium]